MSLTARDTGGGDFELCPADTHAARCYLAVDIGTHVNPISGKWQNQCVLGWELPEAAMEDGRPFAISRFYTVSLHEKATLRQHLDAWRGRSFSEEELAGFHLSKVLGAPCLLTVIHEANKQGTVKAKVASVTKAPGKMEIPDAVNSLLYYDLDNPDAAVFEKLPEWIQNKIRESREWNEIDNGFDHGGNGEEATDDELDPIPF